jgi:tRNA(Arg) A34 adenosine deaminase TadA
MSNSAFMRRAVELALEKMRQNGDGPFGAVVVRDDEVIAEGWNQVTATNDPTAHAEIVALRRACAALGRFELPDCEIFANCEPCPMCLGAIYWARLQRIYYANDREDAARIGFDDRHIYGEVSKPIEQGAIPAVRVLGQEALVAFDKWLKKPDKTPY